MYPDTSFEKGKFKPTVHTLTSFSCTKSAGFLKRSQSKDFWKHLLLVYVWTDEKGGFGYDDVIHHLLLVLRILCGGCYLISIVLALSCGRAIRVHAYFFFLFFFFLETEKTIIKNTYPDTCGRGLNSFCVFFLIRKGTIVAEFKLTFKTSLTAKEAMAPLKQETADGKLGSLEVDSNSLKLKDNNQGKLPMRFYPKANGIVSALKAGDIS